MAHSLPLKLSASALRAYQECKYRYALSYVYRLPNAQRVPVASLSFGNAVHQTLAQFQREGGHSSNTKDDIVSMLVEHWDSSPYQDPDIELSMFHRAKEMVERFYDSPYPQAPVQTLGIEQKLTWTAPRRQILATGRIDYVCLHGDGTLEVVDYKTSYRPKNSDDLSRDFQAVIYRSLAAERFHRLKPSRILLTFHYLECGSSVTIEIEQEDFLERWGRIEEIAGRIRNSIDRVKSGTPILEEFSMTRGNGCRHCPMRGHCDEVAPRPCA